MRLVVCAFLCILLISCKRDVIPPDDFQYIHHSLKKAWDYVQADSVDYADTLLKDILALSFSARDTNHINAALKGLAHVSLLRKDTGAFAGYKDSLLVYSRCNEQYAWSLIYLGNLYFDSGSLDDSEIYYQQALQLANGREYAYLKSSALDKLVKIYMHRGMFKNAFDYLHQFRYSGRSKEVTPYILLSKGNIWNQVFEYDSAFYYYKLASESTNNYVSILAYQKLSALWASQGRYDFALSSLQNYGHLLAEEERNISSREMEIKYQEEKMKNVLNEMKLAKRNRELFIVVLAACMVFAVIVGYVFYLRNKNMRLKHTKEVSNLREKEASLREALFRKMSVSHKIPSLDVSDNSIQRGDKRITLSETDWKEIVQIVNDSYDEFVNRLRQNFPLLTEKDIQFCCLVKINVTLKDLSDIYCVSKSAITKKKFRIKTEKIGFKESDQSLDDFLQRF